MIPPSIARLKLSGSGWTVYEQWGRLQGSEIPNKQRPEALRKFNNFKTNGGTLLRRLGFLGMACTDAGCYDCFIAKQLNRITDDALALIIILWELEPGIFRGLTEERK